LAPRLLVTLVGVTGVTSHVQGNATGNRNIIDPELFKSASYIIL